MTHVSLMGARVDGKQSTRIRISNKLKPRHSLKCLRSFFLAYFLKLLAFSVRLLLVQLRDGRKPFISRMGTNCCAHYFAKKVFLRLEGSEERPKRFLGVKLELDAMVALDVIWDGDAGHLARRLHHNVG
jgi:hypothetical protein